MRYSSTRPLWYVAPPRPIDSRILPSCKPYSLLGTHHQCVCAAVYLSADVMSLSWSLIGEFYPAGRAIERGVRVVWRIHRQLHLQPEDRIQSTGRYSKIFSLTRLVRLDSIGIFKTLSASSKYFTFGVCINRVLSADPASSLRPWHVFLRPRRKSSTTNKHIQYSCMSLRVVPRCAQAAAFLVCSFWGPLGYIPAQTARVVLSNSRPRSFHLSLFMPRNQ